MEYEQRPAMCDVLMARQIFRDGKSKNGQKRPAGQAWEETQTRRLFARWLSPRFGPQ
jgi:hypothetical protein